MARRIALVIALMTAGCGGAAGDDRPAASSPPDDVAIWTASIGTVADEEPRTPQQIFVLDKVCEDAGRSNWADRCSAPIDPATQQALLDELQPPPTVRFVSQFDPLYGEDGFLKDGGLLMLLGPVEVDGDRATVGLNYTAENPSNASDGVTFELERTDDGWRVTGGSGVSGSA